MRNSAIGASHCTDFMRCEKIFLSVRFGGVAGGAPRRGGSRVFCAFFLGGFGYFARSGSIRLRSSGYFARTGSIRLRGAAFFARSGEHARRFFIAGNPSIGGAGAAASVFRRAKKRRGGDFPRTHTKKKYIRRNHNAESLDLNAFRRIIGTRLAAISVTVMMRMTIDDSALIDGLMRFDIV